MAKKETKNMLIRDVPYDVWERVDMVCRRLSITRRDFIERCLVFFENDGAQEGWEQEVAKAREAREDGQTIVKNIKAYKETINLIKDINKIADNLDSIRDRDLERNIHMDLVRHRTNLQRLIKTYVPDYNIPEDPEERKKMGIPSEYLYDYVNLTEEQVKERNKTMYGPVSNSHDNDGADSDGHSPVGDFDMTPEEIEAELKKLMAKQNEADTHEDEMDADNHQEDEVRDTDDRGDEPSERHNEGVDVYELNRSRRRKRAGSEGK
jgi:hypothetical protein